MGGTVAAVPRKTEIRTQLTFSRRLRRRFHSGREGEKIRKKDGGGQRHNDPFRQHIFISNMSGYINLLYLALLICV